MPSMFFGKALKVDLSGAKLEEIQLEDSLYRERIGGAGIIASLLEDVREDVIALGVGPLTGTPCPAGSAAIACVADKDGKKRYAPILLNGGLELRLTGFDFIIISGVSPEPSYLWVRDMIADLLPFPSDSASDCWASCSRIRKDQGDPRIQVISCSEGDSASLNFTSGWDGIGLGARMRNMNLRAIAFRGMAEIELHDPEKFLEKSSEMMRAFPGSINGKIGLESLMGEAPLKIPGLRRSRACFSCTFPCLSYAESRDPAYPQFLVLDQRGIAALSRQGLPVDRILGHLSSEHRKGNAMSSDIRVFDTITEGLHESERIAAAYILGLCPRYIGTLKPRFDEYCELLSIGRGERVSEHQVLQVAGSLMRA